MRKRVERAAPQIDPRTTTAGALNELTLQAFALFEPSDTMEHFLELLAERLGCVAALCVESSPDGAPARLLGAAGISRDSRSESLPPADRAQGAWERLPLPYPELQGAGLVRWAIPIDPGDGDGETRSHLLLVFDSEPAPARLYRAMLERLARTLQMALWHRQLYARTLDSERRLGEQKSLLECQIEAAAEGILVVSPDMRVTWFNRRFLNLWGVSERDLRATGPTDARRHECFTRVEEQLPDEATTTEELRLADGRVIERYSVPIRAGDGTLLWRAIYDRDVTRRRRADEERRRLLDGEKVARADAQEAQRRWVFVAEASRLLASLQYENALANLATLAVPFLGDWCAVDLVQPDGSLRRLALAHANPSCAEATRRACPPDASGPEGIARSIRSGLSVIYAGVCPEEAGRHLSAPEGQAAVRELGCSSFMVAPLVGQSATIGALTFVSATDPRRYGSEEMALAEELARRAALTVENARLYEATRQAVSMREGFLSVASHELRQPLSALRMGLETVHRMLVAGELGPEPPEAMSRSLALAQRQERRLTRMIDDMLDVVRIRSGRIGLELEQVDLVALTREVAAAQQTDLAAARCELTVDAPGDVDGFWDRARLEQIIGNLMSNAMKYGRGRPIALRVRGTRDVARIEVEDCGIGIDPAQQEDIFRPFVRASESRIGGLGLGLFVVRGLVRALGGEVSVASQPGEGSTFTVSLPRGGPALE